jgi:hypothetical protein
MNSSSYDYTTSDEEFHIEEEEDIGMVLTLHADKNKRSKHGGSVIGRETLKRERADADCLLCTTILMTRPSIPGDTSATGFGWNKVV